MRFERWMGGVWSLSLTSQGNRQTEGSHDSFKVHSNRSTEPRSDFEKLHFPLSAADRFPLTQPALLRLCFSLCRSRYLCFGNVRVTFVMAGGKMCLFSFSLSLSWTILNLPQTSCHPLSVWNNSHPSFILPLRCYLISLLRLKETSLFSQASSA